MTIKRYKRVSRVWEYSIAIIICSILLYRVALIYDLVPEYLKTSVWIAKEYRVIKAALRTKARETGTSADSAKMAINIIEDTEEYFAKRIAYAKQKAIAKTKCQTNEVHDFFMGIGDSEYQQCIEREIRLLQQRPIPSTN